MGGHVAGMMEMRNACNISVWKPEVKRSFGRPRHRQEDDIKMDLERYLVKRSRLHSNGSG
jgi:hypothetical protein